MPLRPTLALCALLSLPLLAGADDQAPSPDQVMSEHKAEIDNRLADIDYKRKRIVEANMNLTGKEGEAFWPIYNTYRSEAEKLSKQHLALILDYAKSYNTGNLKAACDQTNPPAGVTSTPLGASSPDQWNAVIDTLTKYGGLTGAKPATDYYTDDFIPTS